jgi:maltooligosyltrehalose trehalohydrolase
MGDRLPMPALKLGAGLLLTSPFTPMLFMGEEWAASTPFQFFTSHPEPELGEATARGRIEEFARMGWDPAEVPDPQDPATYQRSKLDWSELEHGRHAVLLEVYRRLAVLRRELPELTDPAFASLTATADEEARVFTLRRGSLVLAVNFSDTSVALPLAGDLLVTTPSTATPDGERLRLPAHAGVLLRER